MAHNLEPALHIGKMDIGGNLIKQADDYLRVHELMKVSIQQSVTREASELAKELADELGAEIIQVIGRKFTLYRANPNLEERIVLPK